MTLSQPIHDNVMTIRQGIELLLALPAPSYTQKTPACFNSSAGGHMRHIIEHYLSFLQGAGSGEIDYEARARDPLIENDPAYAVSQLEAIAERLEQLPADGALRVRSESHPANSATLWCATSVLRELEFLLSHTVHHYALIGVICQLTGHTLPKHFGMAPSTLRYLQTKASATWAR